MILRHTTNTTTPTALPPEPGDIPCPCGSVYTYTGRNPDPQVYLWWYRNHRDHEENTNE